MAESKEWRFRNGVEFWIWIWVWRLLQRDDEGHGGGKRQFIQSAVQQTLWGGHAEIHDGLGIRKRRRMDDWAWLRLSGFILLTFYIYYN